MRKSEMTSLKWRAAGKTGKADLSNFIIGVEVNRTPSFRVSREVYLECFRSAFSSFRDTRKCHPRSPAVFSFTFFLSSPSSSAVFEREKMSRDDERNR